MSNSLYKIINKFNNYDWSDLQPIKDYLLKGIFPRFRTNAQRYRFIQKYKDFIVKNNKIIYKPLNLEVIPNDKKDETLKEFYDGFKAIGTGKTNFYKKITSNYININREYTTNFLNQQPYYQMNMSTKHIVNKPILASSCGERIAIDLISVDNLAEFNKGYNQILTVIDYFSRKVWARPLKNKESDTVLTALKSIFDEITFKPHIVQSDNGGEFKNYETIHWYKENGIKYIFTLPYAPESNGLIENFNKQLRKMIREIFIRNNNLNWLDYLQVCIDNKNTQFNKTTKHTPNQLWHTDSFYHNVKNNVVAVPNDNTIEASRLEAAENIKEKAKQQIERTIIDELNVGDHVRVKMSALYSELRKQVKAGNKKLINVTYTPEIYRIFKIIKEDHPTYERKRYTLKRLDGTPLETETKINEMRHKHKYKRLFASDLLKVDKDTKNVSYNNIRANQLNQIDKLVIDKPITIKEKVKKINNIVVEEEAPQQLRRSTRTRKERDVLDL